MRRVPQEYSTATPLLRWYSFQQFIVPDTNFVNDRTELLVTQLEINCHDIEDNAVSDMPNGNNVCVTNGLPQW